LPLRQLSFPKTGFNLLWRGILKLPPEVPQHPVRIKPLLKPRNLEPAAILEQGMISPFNSTMNFYIRHTMMKLFPAGKKDK